MATSQDIFRQINNAINPENSTKRPTFPWIAGTFKKTYDFNRIERALRNHSEELEPSTLENFRNTLKLRDIAVENGLITVKREGSEPVYKISEKGNRFLQELSKNISRWESLNDLSFKQLRSEVQSAKSEADQEWYDNLSPVDQHIIDIYSRLTPKEFHFLIGLKNAKDDKQKYVNRIETLQDSDPESYSILRDSGFINNKDQINNVLVTKFFATLAKYDYRHLRSFNRSISSKTDRIAADKALVRNELERSMDKNSPRSSEAAVRAREFIETANGCTKGWIQALTTPGNGVRCSQVDWDDLQSKGIVDGQRHLTNYGKFIANILKNGLPDNEKDTLNSRMPSNVGAPNDRQQQRSKILGGRSSEFNDRLHRTKAAATTESKNLSFKKFLTESK
jgi:hypothetical protein